MSRTFTYKKEAIVIDSIGAFYLSSRSHNDKNNKTRENIIGAIINKKVPESFYENISWQKMKNAVDSYLEKLGGEDFTCLHRAGRKFNYDFDFITPQRMFHIELKYNADAIEDAPQFVSPMKPSQYMSRSYEEYYYDNYLSFLAAKGGLPMPVREDFLKQIHSTKPKCMIPYQELYYKGCHKSSKYSGEQDHIDFYELAKEKTNESISTFIEETTLNTEALSTYFQSSQQDKIYMLYSDGEFKKQEVNMEDYLIDKVYPNSYKYRFEVVCKSGKNLNILLRWKNGHGIAFPAFQISQL